MGPTEVGFGLKMPVHVLVQMAAIGHPSCRMDERAPRMSTEFGDYL